MADHIAIAPDFIGISNPQSRDEALTQPLNRMAETLCAAFDKQADASRYIDKMLEMIEPIAQDRSDQIVAGLNAIKHWVTQWDNEMCRSAGIAEALVLRLNAAASIVSDEPNKGGGS